MKNIFESISTIAGSNAERFTAVERRWTEVVFSAQDVITSLVVSNPEIFQPTVAPTEVEVTAKPEAVSRIGSGAIDSVATAEQAQVYHQAQMLAQVKDQLREIHGEDFNLAA